MKARNARGIHVIAKRKFRHQQARAEKRQPMEGFLQVKMCMCDLSCWDLNAWLMY